MKSRQLCFQCTRWLHRTVLPQIRAPRQFLNWDVIRLPYKPLPSITLKKFNHNGSLWINLEKLDFNHCPMLIDPITSIWLYMYYCVNWILSKFRNFQNDLIEYWRDCINFSKKLPFLFFFKSQAHFRSASIRDNTLMIF